MMLELPVLSQLEPFQVPSKEQRARRVYIETYGCQMNLNDSEIVLGILHANGYGITEHPEDADVILINTCAVREHAEQRVFERLNHLKPYKRRKPELVVGILGCMAERLRSRLLGEKRLVELVVGPDEYRKLPQLLEQAFAGEQGIAVRLSRVETYDDIEPLRTEGISAWISIMRGCDKFCTFCIVPFTRGRERSRPLQSIVAEVRRLWQRGFKEVTLLGQNVNSYRDPITGADFADLLAACAEAAPQMRIRYLTSHPRDMSDKLIDTMAAYPNLCKYIHLPVQSGSNRILALMNRGYTVEQYLERVERIRSVMPDCALSTDIIAGFCTETEEDHQATLELLRTVRYDGAYMFKYSPREGTKAWKWGDDVPEEVKVRRLNEIIALQQQISYEINREKEIGRLHEVLVEGPSKRNPEQWQGRTDTNKVVIFPKSPEIGTGSLIRVRIRQATSATLFGEVVAILEPASQQSA
ncbi:MAG: tRNA (N6-isopentenyl adenosine(37)-C2)-methylthiotransferase MiaB [Candidatus Kapabacteria bacterium]|nr:tRNA (N6-isopentenyl adenosine(37)-C2)-methylthiotransferase MiaB [Candidatus Kapabacteria bacterium]MDW8012607.1 tRNA (N6-isopentenyl adenosine(37)-C2)-methylthiotransferase MiaB [Bacteroidota bacterium]